MMKRFFKLDLITLTLSAIGALGLSAHNTYIVMEPSGRIIAIAAVAALELGLTGFIVSLEPKKHTGWVGIQWSQAKRWSPALLIVAMLITTNFLANVEMLGVAVSPQLQNWTRLLVLGVFIPFLTIVTLHAAHDVWMKYAHESSDTKLTKAGRIRYIKNLMNSGESLNSKELSAQFGVHERTVKIAIADAAGQIEAEKIRNEF